MKKITLLILGLAAFSSCKDQKQENTKEETSVETSMEETTTQENEWIVLFDGTSTDAWHGYNQDEGQLPEQWKVEDNALVLYPTEGETHNLVTNEDFESFELSLEWKISEAGNSGIMWGVKEMDEYNEPYYTGPEIQVLDNEKHPDAKVKGKTHQAGALYDMVEPVKDLTSPVGEWNTYVITINHEKNYGSVTHNGELITEFPVNGEEWETMVADSKFKDWKDFGKYKSGKIALQDHSDTVAFRNIKIKKIQ